MSSIRDRIAAVQGGNTERVRVPEWDDIELEFRPITVKQRADIMALAEQEDGEPDSVRFGLLLIVASAHDPDSGEEAFTPDDVDMLAAQSAGVMDRLAIAAARVSGLADGAGEAGKDDS